VCASSLALSVWQQVLQRARIVTIGRAELRFATLEDLIIHKVIAGRPRDLEDVRTVLLKNSNVDAAYIRQWLEEFERALAEPYLQRFEEIWKVTR
jgi:predicted nucleotidyltransferase